MMKRFFLATLFLALLGLITTLPAHAEKRHSRVITSAETVTGDLHIFGDDLLIEEDATLPGNVHVWGGDAVINGTILGDFLATGGDVRFGPTARVAGNCVVIGGHITDPGDAEDGRSDLNCTRTRLGALSGESADMANALRLERSRGAVVAAAIGAAISGAIIAALIALVAPRRLDLVEDAIATRPIVSGVVGGMTFLSTIVLIILLALLSTILLIVCIGLVGYLALIALVALFALALVMGWVAVGSLFGEQMVQWLRLPRLRMPVVAALGTGTLSFLLGILEMVPAGSFTAGAARVLLVLAGLGAVALTRFGSQPWPRDRSPEIITPSADPDKVQSAIDNMPF
jgi:hypothetical protein